MLPSRQAQMQPALLHHDSTVFGLLIAYFPGNTVGVEGRLLPARQKQSGRTGPSSAVAERGSLEIKCPAPHTSQSYHDTTAGFACARLGTEAALLLWNLDTS